QPSIKSFANACQRFRIQAQKCDFSIYLPHSDDLRTNIFNSEGCIYFTRETAIQKTDIFFNSIIAEKWMEIYPQWNGYINMNPPRNALKTLTTTCRYDPRKETIGFLYGMGCENILNISGIAGSHFLQNKLKKGKSFILPIYEAPKFPMNTECNLFVSKLFFKSCFLGNLQAITVLTSKPILTKEFVKQYAKLENFIVDFIKTEGNNTSRHLTKQFMPCFKAYEAYSSAVGAILKLQFFSSSKIEKTASN
ncbi:hypothetical protein ACTXT7_014509, partial [Hymenolepis weldensis]